MGKQAYELELPPTMKMHDVFHVSLLKPYHKDGTRQPPPITILWMVKKNVKFKI